METDRNKENRVVFLKGRKVILRPPNKKTDLANCMRWINDPEVNYFLSVYIPQTEAMEEEWFDGMGKDDKNIAFAIETLEGRHIGNIGLHRINWKDRTATTGAVIGEKEFWGNGYGTDAKMLLLDFAFNTLGLEKVNSEVFEFNERSVNYSLKCGYVIEGRRRSQVFRHGRRWDIIQLGVLRKEWLIVWEKYRETDETNGGKKK
jgi:RimJ/RimL family protein N-acetyltransferase